MPIQDLRYGVRSLQRAPAFTIGALATLSISIAAVAVVFTLGYTLLYRPPAVPDSDSLVIVSATRNHGRDLGPVSYPDYQRFSTASSALADVAAYYGTAPLWVTSGDRVQEINGSVVTANYFRLLGLQPSLGRFFHADEDQVPDRDHVAVLSHQLWRSWFQASPDVLGSTLHVNGVVFTVVGVAPERWRGLGTAPAELYIPMMTIRTGYRWCDAIVDTDCTILQMVGRLGADQTTETAQAEMTTRVPVAWTNRADDGGNTGVTVFHPRGATLRPSAEDTRFVRLLALAAGVLLLVCCANLAGLTAARTTTRERELATRASLGASPSRLLRQLMTESLLLAAGGGALGLILSQFLVRVISAAFYQADVAGRPLSVDFGVDPGVVTSVFAVATLAAVVFGLAPALRITRSDTMEVLRAGRAAGSQSPWARVLVGVQAAVAVGLALVTVLLVQSSASGLAAPRLDASRVVVMRLRPRLVGRSPQMAQRFLRAVLQRFDQHPTAESATVTALGGVIEGLETDLPLSGAAEGPGSIHTRWGEIGPRYFETLGIPLLRGREFAFLDRPDTPRVAIVNEALAKRLWAGGDVVGRHVVVGGVPHEVVGLVADATPASRAEGPQPHLYTAFWQNPDQVDARVAVRVRGDAAAAIPLLVREVAGVDPEVPVSETVSLPFQIANGVLQPVRVTAVIVGYAAGLAILLAAVGLWAMLAFDLARRTREIGVRLALGATPTAIRWMILLAGARPVLAGLPCGLLLGAAGIGLVTHLIYQPAGGDWPSYVAVTVLFLGVATLAAWLPARRAAAVMPLEALRQE